ncbi:hypothetical protein OSSY52_10770 [Tepiditoga spiralis]|uniref:Peptidase C1A papain C-terminal domain-containing protein n=1 Tax=Tepiditoga spiralis TaxID=2108365 RepID=A0A7G1G6G2_9BACT|nr:C1 family peptidase [Tepiditoga spiralis]BBE30936.1 hypothetical protein OSSY52_10770 [Tepiditoga spiralis]
MKKILLTVLLVLLVTFMLAGVLEESNELANSINLTNVPWMAGVNQYFVDLQENTGISNLNSLNLKVNKYKFLPDSFISKKLNANKLTTNDDVLWSSKYVYSYNGDTLPSAFIQIHSPIKNQGSHGTCWAFSTIASLESAMLVQKSDLNPTDTASPVVDQDSTYDFSEQYMAYHDVDWDLLAATGYETMQEANTDVGGNVYFSSYNLIRYGYVDESAMPYSAYDGNKEISWNAKSNWNSTLKREVQKTIYLPGYKYNEQSYSDYINSIKEALKRYGALSVSYSVPNDFGVYIGGVYVPSDSFAKYTGGHAVTLVGWMDMATLKQQTYSGTTTTWVSSDATCVKWNDPITGKNVESTEFWLIKNSWGTSWGWDGYFLVPIATKEQFDNKEIERWMIENNSMYVPVYQKASTAVTDFDNDGDTDIDDYNALKTAIENYLKDKTYDAKYDISDPKDGRLDGNDMEMFFQKNK